MHIELIRNFNRQEVIPIELTSVGGCERTSRRSGQEKQEQEEAAEATEGRKPETQVNYLLNLYISEVCLLTINDIYLIVQKWENLLSSSICGCSAWPLPQRF